MKPKLFQNNIAVKKSPVAGYGVFAEKEIKIGEIVEECHYVPVRNSFRHHEAITDYFFKINNSWGALILGYGAIYNHADDPNVEYVMDEILNLAIFTAVKPIAKDEELFITYGEEWFPSRARIKIEAENHRWIISFWIRRIFIVCSVIFATQQLYHYYPDLLSFLHL
jgi:hypothetical protein